MYLKFAIDWLNYLKFSFKLQKDVKGVDQLVQLIKSIESLSSKIFLQ